MGGSPTLPTRPTPFQFAPSCANCQLPIRRNPPHFLHARARHTCHGCPSRRRRKPKAGMRGPLVLHNDAAFLDWKMQTGAGRFSGASMPLTARPYIALLLSPEKGTDSVSRVRAGGRNARDATGGRSGIRAVCPRTAGLYTFPARSSFEGGVESLGLPRSRPLAYLTQRIFPVASIFKLYSKVTTDSFFPAGRREFSKGARP